MKIRPKRPLVDRPLEQLNRRVEPVLLDHEQLHARLIARLDQRVGGVQRDRHGLLGDHVLARLRRRDAVLRVQSRRRGHDDRIGRHLGEHGVEAREPRALPQRAPACAGALLDDVAHRDELEAVDAGDRLAVLLADPAAAEEGDAHGRRARRRACGAVTHADASGLPH
jgi:hypothetical protein